MVSDYEKELNFLCDTFRKCHVSAQVLALTDPAARLYPSGFCAPLAKDAPQETVRQHLGEILPETVYKIRDEMNRCYRYLLLPDGKNSTVLFIGPYFNAPVLPSATLELAERMGIPPKSQRYFNEYYSTIPLLEEGNHLFILLDTFCERLWNRPSFSIVDRNREYQTPVSPIHETAKNDDFDGILVSMKTMETRYAFENELMRAVSLGQIHKEEQLFPSLSDYPFEKRTTDPLRNAKNYCIIMNTLLRKAAEQGGVHPVYINNVSSEFAVKIEQLSSLSETAYLMREMFRTYCRLVRKHSMKDYSLLVQKTILLIDSDLSADLTLSTLAHQQNVTAGYLATVFKRETGKTVSEYIRQRRIKHASYLLATTHLQVQTVALHCGIVDVQYFSKIFKKETGKTPKEYREGVKK